MMLSSGRAHIRCRGGCQDGQSALMCVTWTEPETKDAAVASFQSGPPR